MKKKALLLTAPLILMGLAGCNKQAEEPTLSNISALSTTSKFNVGEQITSDSVIVQGEYSNGYSKKITSGYTVNPTLPYTFSEGDVGTKQFTITYNDKTTTFNVTVEKQGSEPTLTGISAMSKVSKFTVGEQITLSNIVVQEKYTNGYSKTVTEGYTITPTLPYTFTSLDIGIKTYTVTYKGMNTTFNVTVDNIPAGFVSVVLVDQIPGGEPVTKTVSVAPGSCLPYPESQHMDDHVLAGWYTDQECQNEFDFNKPITSTTQLYSKWVDATTDGLAFVPDNETNPTYYTVAVDVENIKKLPKNVVIPAYHNDKPVVSIYAQAPYANAESKIQGFSGTSIETISIPSTIVKIPEFAFMQCLKLKYVSLPSNIKEIGAEAFGMTKSLKNIYFPEGLTDIGEAAFYESGIVSVKLPSTLKRLTTYSFIQCRSLESVDCSTCMYLTEICASSFTECISLYDVKLPNNGNLTQIGEAAFGGCYCLTSITIPDSVTIIGEQAFTACFNLKSIYFGNESSLETIGNGAFTQCLNLQKFIIPKYVNNIANNAFKNCVLLDAEFLNTDDVYKVTYNGATYDDYKPNDLAENYPTPTQLLTSESGSTVARKSKSDVASGYKYYTCVGGCKISGRVDDSESLTEYTVPLKITENSQDLNVVGIGDGAFYYNVNIKKVTFEVDISGENKNLISIGAGAFFMCCELEQIINLDKCVNLEIIRESAFRFCTASSESEDLITLDLSNTKLKIIGEDAFYSTNLLKEITLPSTLIHVGNQAFYSCINLENADFKLCSNLQTIGYESLLATNSNSNTTTFGSVFYGCQKLEEVDLSNTKITNIPYQTFYGCTNINKPQSSNDVTKTGLKRVKLPNTVLKISEKAFYGDHLLESINIPKCVYTLGQECFSQCFNLREVIIESSVSAKALYETNLSHSLFTFARDVYVPAGTEMSDKFKAIFTKGESSKEGFDVWTDHENDKYISLKPCYVSEDKGYYYSKVITTTKDTEYTFRIMLNGTTSFQYLALYADYANMSMVSTVVDKTKKIEAKYYASEGADPVIYDKLYDTSDYSIAFLDSASKPVVFNTGYVDITFTVSKACDLYCVGGVYY